jgi:hypothetical protein
MKHTYCFDPDTGEFTGKTDAHLSPLEPGKYLLPENATFEKPPPSGYREVPVRVGYAWEIRPDWRGAKLFSIHNGEEVQIKAIGQTPEDAEATDQPRPDETHIWKKGRWVVDATRCAEVRSQRQTTMWKAIKAERDNRRQSGGYCVGGKWFHSDQISRNQQLALAMTAIPDNLQWKTMDGTFVAMTAELAQQILAAASANDQAIFAAAEMHKAAMLADPLSYDFSKGWPDRYE